MQKILKAVLIVVIMIGAVVLGGAVWAMRELDRYHSLSPSERAKEDKAGQVASERARRERLKGTGCEKLDALSCYDLRRKRRNLEALAQAYENSDLKKAQDDAGVR